MLGARATSSPCHPDFPTLFPGHGQQVARATLTFQSCFLGRGRVLVEHEFALPNKGSKWRSTASISVGSPRGKGKFSGPGPTSKGGSLMSGFHAKSFLKGPTRHSWHLNSTDLSHMPRAAAGRDVHALEHLGAAESGFTRAQCAKAALAWPSGVGKLELA
jgi:hypothetical protein